MFRRLASKLPAGVKDRLRRILGALRVGGLRLFSMNGFLAGVYFAFFSRRFRREHRAVLRGRLRYYRNLEGGGRSSPQLRRNIHRLEKGLVMRPRRPVFAEGFIGETVLAYERARGNADYSPDELQWASHVLDAYFEAVEETRVIAAARRKYGSFAQPVSAPDRFGRAESRPYPRSRLPETSVAFDDLLMLFLRRRSVRWYLSDPVPIELIRKAVDAAALAPSACNRQPFRFIITTDPDQAHAIAACAGGTVGFAQQLPALIVVVGDLSAYPFERDRHLIYIDSALASMQLMLAAETLGLATCPINWPDVEPAERKIQQILEFEPHERVIMLIAIGYGDPEGGVPFSQKKQGDLLSEEFRPK
ncbi:MAG: nitroreductase family protein [Gammaproteobacteria bacterium]